MYVVYISVEQAWLLGWGSLSLLFNSCMISVGMTPGYGILPDVNISQHTTPNDHYV